MSTLLYSLGRWAYHHPWRVLVSWLLLLALAGGGAAVFMKGTDNSFSIPGTEAQEGIQLLDRTFPQASGTSAQLVLVAPSGESVSDGPIAAIIADTIDELEQIDGVTSVTDPFNEMVTGLVSEDEQAAIIRLQFDGQATDVSPESKAALTDAAADVRAAMPEGSRVAIGGDLFSTSVPALSLIEAVGVLIALFVLIVTFRSLAVAWFPLVSAIIGVALAIALIYLSTAFASISSTTPMLAHHARAGRRHRLRAVHRGAPSGPGARRHRARGVGRPGDGHRRLGRRLRRDHRDHRPHRPGFAGIPFLTTMGDRGRRRRRDRGARRGRRSPPRSSASRRTASGVARAARRAHRANAADADEPRRRDAAARVRRSLGDRRDPLGPS